MCDAAIGLKHKLAKAGGRVTKPVPAAGGWARRCVPGIQCAAARRHGTARAAATDRSQAKI